VASSYGNVPSALSQISSTSNIARPPISTLLYHFFLPLTHFSGVEVWVLMKPNKIYSRTQFTTHFLCKWKPYVKTVLTNTLSLEMPDVRFDMSIYHYSEYYTLIKYFKKNICFTNYYKYYSGTPL
jgi:hypothetical protein